MQDIDPAFAKNNKYLIYFSYNTKKICSLNIETGSIEKHHKIDLDIKKYQISKLGYTYKWHYNDGDTNVYLRENYHGDNHEKRGTKVYKIDIEQFEISEMFYSKKYFFKICVRDNYLYLLRYVEPSNENLNKEKNYIVLHNLLNGSEAIINFNKTLPENEQIYASEFFVNENKIILLGRTNLQQPKNLYLYNVSTNTIKMIDNSVTQFSVHNNMVFYNRYTKQQDNSIAIYNLDNNTHKPLPYKVTSVFRDFLIIDENVMVYTTIRKTPRYYIDKVWIFRSLITHKNYYIADIKKNNRKMFFRSCDDIEILGVMKNKNECL